MWEKALKDTFGIVKDAAETAFAPIAAAVGVAREVTKPIADAAKDTVETIHGTDDKPHS